MFFVDTLTIDLHDATQREDGTRFAVHGIDARYLVIGMMYGVPMFIVADEDLEYAEAEADKRAKELMADMVAHSEGIPRELATIIVEAAAQHERIK